MFDWTRYTQTAGDLTGVGGQIRKVSQEELVKHNRDEDAWTVVRGEREKESTVGEQEREREIIALTIILSVIFEGVVYNITPFMKYHPGGKAQLMRGAGNDCTELFDKVIDLLYTEHAVNLLYSVIADLESICLLPCTIHCML